MKQCAGSDPQPPDIPGALGALRTGPEARFSVTAGTPRAESVRPAPLILRNAV